MSCPTDHCMLKECSGNDDGQAYGGHKRFSIEKAEHLRDVKHHHIELTNPSILPLCSQWIL